MTDHEDNATSGPDAHGAASKGVVPSLRAMMFLEYAVKGLWFPLLAVMLSDDGLGFSAEQRGWIIGTASAVGAMCAPFIAGQIADRYFNTERFLAFCLFFAGMIKFITADQTDYSAWLWLSVAYSILYMPTVALTNSLAMYHLPDPKRQFPGVRVWGTIGWIAVAWIFPMLWLQTNHSFQWLPPFFKGDDHPDIATRMLDSMRVAGVVAVGYAVFCLLRLPATPPSSDRTRGFAFARAFGLLRKPSFAVLLGATFVISCVHMLYFIHTSRFLKVCGLSTGNVMPAMSLGQFSEIAVMAALGSVLHRFGFRFVMAAGALSYFLRYLVFAIPDVGLPLVIGSLVLHGICFACFFAAGFIYVDRIAPPDVRHSAQTIYTLVMFGVGPAVTGGWLNGFLIRTVAGGTASLDRAGFSRFWMSTAVIALVATVLFFMAFRDETEGGSSQNGEADA